MKKQPTLDDTIRKLTSSKREKGSFKSAAAYFRRDYVPPTTEHEHLANAIALGIENSIKECIDLNDRGRYRALMEAVRMLKKSQVSVYDLEKIETRLARVDIYTIYTRS